MQQNAQKNIVPFNHVPKIFVIKLNQKLKKEEIKKRDRDTRYKKILRKKKKDELNKILET